jgi:hypothetical protein
MCFEALLTILLSLTVWHGDAYLSPESRTVLYSPTIDAICRVGKTTDTTVSSMTESLANIFVAAVLAVVVVLRAILGDPN